MNFLSSKALIAFSVFMGLQAFGAYVIHNRPEFQPNVAPLATLPASIGLWRMVGEYPIEKEVQDILKATDTLSRIYSDAKSPYAVSLFIAYFKSQRSGVAPHSPKNCLPGNGWVPETSDIIHIPVPGVPEGIEVNQYIVQKGDVKNVVIYWYQSHGRIVASEYKAKAYVIADAISKNRTDTSLVKVIAPVGNNDLPKSIEVAHRFIADSFPAISAALPN